ncbi:queuine tRNA-ribosyltransferase accessory subunit [Entomortierella parvispora]|uniref:Queuine tRNA-ribosyltransferase accessory subunit 2 n=1 Tax=Entomortierella parvispora TaxID=205924 RepID=A0A9P3H9U0_9FUNG|nr:queuine tRNA-ribosyltransferase accessory subunit [Entomortierella parvispora]
MPPLSFSLIRQSTHRSAARRGTLVMASSPSSPAGTGLVEKRVIETPGCFMYSVKGSVPHLTPDTLRLQGFGGVHVSMEHLLQDHQTKGDGLEKWTSFNLSKFLHLQDMILLCDIRDPSRYAKVPFNSDRYVSMLTHKGVRQLTLEDYLKCIRAYEPDIVAIIADSISDLEPATATATAAQTTLAAGGDAGAELTSMAGPKRVRKSVDRSLRWLDQVLRDRQGFDTLAEQKALDVARKEERRLSLQKMKEQQAAQKAGGADNADALAQVIQDLEVKDSALPTLTSQVKLSTVKTKTPWTHKSSVFAHVVGSQIEQERIRSAEETAKRDGVDGFIVDVKDLSSGSGFSHEEVLKLLKVSLDHLPAEKPRLVYGMQTPEDVLSSIALGADLFDTTYPYHLTEDGKASLFSFGASSESQGTADATAASSSSAATASTTNRWINLWDDEHANKFVPIMEGCECYACKGGKHTRAYINHLLKAHEMLATVLLMSHNMHQYSKFFANVRQSIQEGTFEEQTQKFVTKFGAREPIRVPGDIHPAQLIVEASLTKRNRLDGLDDSHGGSSNNGDLNKSSSIEDGGLPSLSDMGHLSAVAAEKEQRRVEREKRREQRSEERKRNIVNKKEKRLQRKLEQLRLQREKELEGKEQ